MKYVIKVETLQNLPETRPLIAMDVNGNLFAEGQAIGPTLEMVDLGLPSGLRWAKTNIGAQTETDYGLYFAWGEVALHEGWPEDKTSHPYGWNEYQYAISDYNELTKYCNNSEYGYQGFTDNLTELVSTDDAATVSFGTDYRMPTHLEFEELMEETNNEWTTINGVNGWKFTNKNDSSKYIFLPAAGSGNSSNLNNVGLNGGYWSSSLNTSKSYCAFYIYFLTNNKRIGIDNNSNRCYCMTVRPVSL